VTKTIAITGAGVGLGRAIARRLAANGDAVILLGRTLSKVQTLADELGAPAMAVECDVADAASVNAAFAKIACVYPNIDVLINNAAVYEPFEIAEASDEQILQPIMTNFAGPLFCCRAVIPMMVRGGHIINVSSESVAFNFPMLSLYQSTKAALERFTESLVGELEPVGIRVTIFRAGPMWEEGKGSAWAPEVAMRFGQACLAKGIDMRSRPISHVNSVAQLFQAVIETPADVQLKLVTVEGRKP
jgi:meso-butanediol dehydrogenase / (S,S)-butanediol dehydrogenase / diacetyl reductase